MRASTTSNESHGHREISFNFDDSIPDSLAPWLVSFLEKDVANGARYLPGQTFQIGWSITRIQELPDGSLGVFEPDLKSMPMNFVDSMNTTLMNLLRQRYVLDSLGFEVPDIFPSMLQSAIVCNRLSSSAHFSIFRVDPEGRDSGWSICCDDRSHNHNDSRVLSRVSLYELGCRYPSLIPYLALPPGIAIYEAGTGNPAVYLNEEELRPKEGSFLDSLWAP